MTWKQTFTMGIVGSLLSSLASIIYLNIYSEAFVVDFSKIAGTSNIIASCTIGGLLLALGYKFAIQWKGKKTIGWLNVAFSILSFASIVGVLGFNLPLDTESPELFPGMVIPMHFFPVLSILTIFPFFNLNYNEGK
ncbi:hypothetical protein [Runella zeae]|uniref:hypothetical protein n=1 Tax=Runella zeae TaxID=94255 RepID=UPI00048D8F3B|nr:hypothetical protein [Runella zeae]